MSELLKMAESYYAVANDLKAQGQRLMEIADLVGRMADSMCEENMRRQKPDSAGGKPR